METTNTPQQIIRRHTLLASGAGLIPIPLLDLAAVTMIQLDMLRQLARHYNRHFSDSQGKAWVVALSGSIAARTGAEAIKLLPGIGSIIGGVSMAALSGASTYAIGKVVVQHFEAGGDASNFDPEHYREAYEDAKAEGKAAVNEMKAEQDATSKKIRDLDQLRQDGLLTDEEFETVKKRLLANV